MFKQFKNIPYTLKSLEELVKLDKHLHSKIFFPL